MNLDIKNYADLTALANATYNADWSVEEYASAYQGNVDVINLLQSGALIHLMLVNCSKFRS